MDNLFQIESFQDFERVLHQLINNLSYSSLTITNSTITEIKHNEFNAAEEDLRNLISVSNFDVNNVIETLSSKPWDKERIKYFINLLEKERTKILYGSINHYNSGYGETITESEWLLKLVLGTSELTTHRYPFMQLIISTVDSNSVRKKKIFELSKDTVMKTIISLEQFTKQSICNEDN